mmetsp:Transcript_13062/g.48493  ORF Transcript_13062/g.48493 Transcript_13062/m.48493 type:complete len:206 (+) Transcript_13062:1827-2444(+)
MVRPLRDHGGNWRAGLRSQLHPRLRQQSAPLLVVALLARRDGVAERGATAATSRDDVVHGQLLEGRLSAVLAAEVIPLQHPPPTVRDAVRPRGRDFDVTPQEDHTRTRELRRRRAQHAIVGGQQLRFLLVHQLYGTCGTDGAERLKGGVQHQTPKLRHSHLLGFWRRFNHTACYDCMLWGESRSYRPCGGVLLLGTVRVQGSKTT